MNDAMSAPFPNLYTLRKVAEVSAKACDICYKPSTSVLITPDSKVRHDIKNVHFAMHPADPSQDFFFVCAVHLKDKYFCTPKVDEAAAKARREKELAEETEKLKKEYEEKQKKKKEKEKEKEAKDKDKKKDDDKDKDADKDKDKKDDKKDDAKDGDEDVSIDQWSQRRG